MNDTPLAAHRSLVLVVGAGASKEVNLPVGEELKQAIASTLGFRVENHVSVELTIGTKIYYTAVTIFSPKGGSYSTKLAR